MGGSLLAAPLNEAKSILNTILQRVSKIEDNFLFPNITVGVSVETKTKFLAGP